MRNKETRPSACKNVVLTRDRAAFIGEGGVGGGGGVIKPLNLDEMTPPTRTSLFRASLSAVSCDGTDD